MSAALLNPILLSDERCSLAVLRGVRKQGAVIVAACFVLGCTSESPDGQSFGGAGPGLIAAGGMTAAPALTSPPPPAPSASNTALPALSADAGSASGGASPVEPGPADTAAPAPSAPVSRGCADSALLMCDDFESGAIDPVRWVGAKPGIEVAEGRAAHGRYALHVTGSAAASNVVMSHTSTFATPRDAIFLRAYVWMAPPLPPRNWNYLILNGEGVMWRMGGTTTPFGSADGERTIRVMHLPLHKIVDSQVPFPTERWMCWELELRREGKVMNLWIEGQLAPSAALPANAGNQPFVFPVFSSLEIGINHPHPEAVAPEVWLDDVALSSTRIGCVAP